MGAGFRLSLMLVNTAVKVSLLVVTTVDSRVSCDATSPAKAKM